MTRSIIVAADKNGLIGKNGKLPWHFPEDLQWFKETTGKSPVVMGRKTFDSLPKRFKPLPNRENIVVTRNVPIEQQPSLKYVTNINQIEHPKVFFIGGAEIYKLALPLIDHIYLTRIPGEYEGDTYFPAWPLEECCWKLAIIVDRPSLSGLKFEIYERM